MSGISIQIDAGSTQATSGAHTVGSLQHIITDEERASFGILDRDLKMKIVAAVKKEPNDAYVKSPTPPFGDLYKTYGWDQVETVLTPIETKVLSVAAVPTTVAKMEFKNESSKKGTFSGKLTEQVTNTVGTSWTKSKTLSFNQDVRYNIGFMGTGAGGSTSFKFDRQWGTNGTESYTTTLGTEAGVTVELNPGEKVVAELVANSGKMKVRVTYEAYLTGDVAVNCSPKVKDHQVYGIVIGGLLGASNSVKATQDIEIGYYSEARVIIRDPAGSILRSEEVPCWL